MQILAIRGRNIASLAQPFDIRLDQPPLSVAGLFAITGETGAGKSSLLDAMCLALYGNCPRLSSGDGTRESVEEADGQELRSNDPRMVLRRGSAEGYAEVAFVGVDGERYEAAWSARRARARIDGRLQAADRSLRRLSDGQVLETQATAVNARIAQLTGLTYDEFRRTVLLAQGDFDAFLCARTADRAAILEKVTGTGLYRDISRRIFERHSEARAALETLETRRAEHRLLTADERADLASQEAALRAEQGVDDAEAAAVRVDLQHWSAFAEAQARLATAEERCERASQALIELAPHRDWLADWDAARVLRGEVRELADARAALSEAGRQRDDLRARQATQAGLLRQTETALRTAIQQRDLTEETFKSFAEAWSRATELDAMILGATDEAAEAARQRDRLRDAEAVTNGRLADVQEKASALDEAIGARQATLTQSPGHEVLLSNWALIEERLEARIDLTGQLATAEARQSGLLRAVAADRTTLASLAGRIEAAADRIRAAQAVQAGMGDERDRLRAADPSGRLQRLGQAAIDLRALRQAKDMLRQADAAVAASVRKQGEARAVQAQAALDGQDAQRRAEEADRLVAALQRPADAAAAAASVEAEHLRRHLVAGQPCPVCHATEHPLMADGRFAALAAELRDRLANAERARDRARHAGLAAQARLAQAEAVLRDEAVQAPQLGRAVDKAEAAAHSARDALLAQGIADVPEDPRAAEALVDAVSDRLVADRTLAIADQDRLADLDRLHVTATSEIEASRTEIATAEADQRRIRESIAAAETELARIGSGLPTLAQDIARIDDRLAPLLAAVGDKPDRYDATGAQALAQLRQTRDRLDGLTSRLAQDRAALALLAPRLAAAQEASAAAGRATTEAAAVLARREADLATLRLERQGLLGGEATASHRTRHNDARKTAQSRLEAAQQAHAASGADLAALSGALAGAETAVTQAARRADLADSALTQACATASLPLERVLALHAATDDDVAARRQRLLAATTERSEAQGALRERQAELETLQAQGLPARTRDDLLARQLALDSAAAGRSETLGRIAERLDADGKAALALAGLEAEITLARQTAETWQAVSDAVGSANGDRFAQIAQAVTLALLVERANLHLDDLKPRYQLEVAPTDLALHVIDRDMAGDRRPVRLLSGGERFLVSLALSLALSGMGTHGALAGTLFIDEGFGTLDSDSLDLAIDALERLQAQGRMIGVISHVQAMKDRIPVQIEVRKTGGGASEVRLNVQ